MSRFHYSVVGEIETKCSILYSTTSIKSWTLVTIRVVTLSPTWAVHRR